MPIIEFIVNYAKQRMNDEKIKINFVMTTNGTLLTETTSKKIKELGIHPMISIDGSPEIQNKQRPFVDGSQSYDATIEGFKSFYKVTGQRLSARATYTSFDLVAIANSLSRIGFRSVYMSPASGPCGEHLRNDIGTTKLYSSYCYLFEYFYNCLVNPSSKSLIPLNNAFIKLINSLTNRQSPPWPCGGGRSFVGISPRGNIYLCHRFIGQDKFCFGNINNSSMDNELYLHIINNAGKRIGRCSICWLKSLCAGGCYYENYKFSGDILQRDPLDCELHKKITEKTVYYYWKLRKYHPNILKKICKIKLLPEHETSKEDKS